MYSTFRYVQMSWWYKMCCTFCNVHMSIAIKCTVPLAMCRLLSIKFKVSFAICRCLSGITYIQYLLKCAYVDSYKIYSTFCSVQTSSGPYHNKLYRNPKSLLTVGVPHFYTTCTVSISTVNVKP